MGIEIDGVDREGRFYEQYAGQLQAIKLLDSHLGRLRIPFRLLGIFFGSLFKKDESQILPADTVQYSKGRTILLTHSLTSTFNRDKVLQQVHERHLVSYSTTPA